MNIRTISSEAELEEALGHSHTEPIMLYKHSCLCELSGGVRENLARAEGGPPVYEIVVQDARPLSNHVEAHFGIRHESPQAIIVSGGRAVFNASHRGVTPEAVRRAAAAT